MSERVFRLIQATYLLAALLLDNATMMYAIIFLYLFEGLTNWRVPIIVSKVRYGANCIVENIPPQPSRFEFDSERAQRLLAAAFLYLTYFVIPDAAWFGPWFLVSIFLMAGFTNICPSIMLLRFVGFK